jgi:hypothetical protein
VVRFRCSDLSVCARLQGVPPRVRSARGVVFRSGCTPSATYQLSTATGSPFYWRSRAASSIRARSLDDHVRRACRGSLRVRGKNSPPTPPS